MSNRIKWILGTVISLGLILFVLQSGMKDNFDNIEYVPQKETIQKIDSSESADENWNYDEEVALIEETIKECLGVYHTYSQLDNTYMCKLAREYITPQCLFNYLMSKMDGKAPWDNDNELMDFLDDYEPNRVNNNYITDPEVMCHVSEIEILYESLDKDYGTIWCHYEVCHDFKTITENQYYDQMARLDVKKVDDKWKVNFIYFISLGGIKGYYEAN